MKKEKVAGQAGRPLQFVPEEALDKAMHLFWKKGYEGTSITDLTDAMGINRPSMYGTFGNKERLFQKAFDRYTSGPASVGALARKKETAYEAASELLYSAAAMLADPEHPGCLSVVGALACSQESDSVRIHLCEARNAGQEAWQERFEQAQKNGELPKQPTAADLARYFMTILNGLSVQARSGATKAELERTVDIALTAWPKV